MKTFSEERDDLTKAILNLCVDFEKKHGISVDKIDLIINYTPSENGGMYIDKLCKLTFH